MPILKWRKDESSEFVPVGTYVPTAEEIGAAPAGYGLGTTGKVLKTLSDCHAIVVSGHYKIVEGTTQNYPPSTNNGMIDAVVYNENSCTLRAYTTDSFIFEKKKTSGVWGEWEWVNPPMTPGVEYRTTERFYYGTNSKPVYVKTISISGLPNSGIKLFEWSDSYTNVPFFVTGIAKRSNDGSYMSLPTDVYFTTSGMPTSGTISISAVEKHIAVETDFDASDFDLVTIIVKYIKTTD